MKTAYTFGIALLACLGARAQDTATNSYTQTNLVSDGAVKAKKTDPNLKNPWGLSRGATPWWVSDNGTGLSTVYQASGTIGKIVVQIQKANGTPGGTPTGTAIFTTFAFVTQDGTIQTWDGSSGTIIKVNNSGASYDGCTVGKIGKTQYLYVANANGGVEVYDTSFKLSPPSGTFTDPNLPPGSAPYGIQSVGTNIYVTYTGPGGGWVSEFDTSGNYKMHLAPGTYMSNPWGVAKAPATGFGKFSKDLLIGMEGSGQIAAFNATTGAFIDVLRNARKAPIANPGLWAIYFGGGAKSNGPKTTLFFAAGINGYADGLFGSLTAK
jgi:uncharacterized protein (TIGR03118 family)